MKWHYSGLVFRVLVKAFEGTGIGDCVPVLLHVDDAVAVAPNGTVAGLGEPRPHMLEMTSVAAAVTVEHHASDPGRHEVNYLVYKHRSPVSTYFFSQMEQRSLCWRWWHTRQ